MMTNKEFEEWYDGEGHVVNGMDDPYDIAEAAWVTAEALAKAQKSTCPLCGDTGWNQRSYQDGVPTVRCSCKASKSITEDEIYHAIAGCCISDESAHSAARRVVELLKEANAGS